MYFLGIALYDIKDRGTKNSVIFVSLQLTFLSQYSRGPECMYKCK